MAVSLQELVECKRAGAAENECGQSSEVEQIYFIARRPELRSCRRDRAKFDRAEAVRKMNGDRRDQQSRPERHADDGSQAPASTANPPMSSTTIVAHAIRVAAGTPSA